MEISEAKRHVGVVCLVQWCDRGGNEQSVVSMVHDVVFVPLYGSHLILDTDDVRLDRVRAISEVDDATASMEQERIVA